MPKKRKTIKALEAFGIEHDATIVDESFPGSIEELYARRGAAVHRIDKALAHIERPHLIAILTSYIGLGDLENSLDTICGPDNEHKLPTPQH